MAGSCLKAEKDLDPRLVDYIRNSARVLPIPIKRQEECRGTGPGARCLVIEGWALVTLATPKNRCNKNATLVRLSNSMVMMYVVDKP